MGKIISLVNQKGGVGKTTTSINLSASLAVLGKKTLLIDLDPQGNTTTGVGINKGDVDKSIYDLLLGRCTVNQATVRTNFKNLSIIPATINLAGADIELIEKSKQDPNFQKNMQLKIALAPVVEEYDFIIIDCPPSLGLLTTNALTAANSVLIPVQCEYYAREGLGQLINTINLVRRHLNKNLEIEGAVLTMYDSRTNLSNQVVKEVKRYFEDRVYKTVIPRNIKLSEAPSYGMPISLYDPRSKGAKSYEKFVKEFLKSNETDSKGKHAL